jgi:hypothetical protein
LRAPRKFKLLLKLLTGPLGDLGSLLGAEQELLDLTRAGVGVNPNLHAQPPITETAASHGFPTVAGAF